MNLGLSGRRYSFQRSPPSFSCCKNVDEKSDGACCLSCFSLHVLSSPEREWGKVGVLCSGVLEGVCVCVPCLVLLSGEAVWLRRRM